MAFIKKRPINEKAESILGTGACWEGTLKTEGSLKIDGRFKGQVVAAGSIVIGENAHVEASLEGSNILIAGTVHGEVKAEGKLEITPKGKLYGNFTAVKLLVDEGAIIRGECLMDSNSVNGEALNPLSSADDEDA
ncbi:MAG: polymer-forming cytoskeletal protein [Syntrophomonadaceae bacterium]|nr:polymer-forming cytoskeletal protein [Thermoanaerobacterales bacterium]NLN20530.1 polymer-forming cytoskeletal protein [Syntrophomonadaceae bacterium]HAF17108.1 cell shape determination protein CcmA [Peptococcaceae bacterium]